MYEGFRPAGTITSVTLVMAVIGDPVGACIDGSHIAYTANISYAGILIAPTSSPRTAPVWWRATGGSSFWVFPT